MNYAVQVWNSLFCLPLHKQVPHETTAAYMCVKKMQKTNITTCSYNKGLDLQHVPIFLTGMF